MSAEESLQPKQFFHGTWKGSLKPGTVLVPGNEAHPGTTAPYQSSIGEHLWTTTQPHWAGQWGEHVYEVKHEGLVHPTDQGADPDPHKSLGATIVRKVPSEEVQASRIAHREKYGHHLTNPESTKFS